MNAISKTSRFAGLMYLGLIILGIGSQVIRTSFIEAGDATATAHNIMADEMLFHAGNVLWLVSLIAFLCLGLALYHILKPVNEMLAGLMLLFVVIGVAVESINTLNVFAAQQLLSGEQYLNAIEASQLEAQALYSLNLAEAGYRIATIMSFGPWLIPTGYLVYKSGYFPKAVGVLAILAGAGHLVYIFQYYFLPDADVLGTIVQGVSVIGEFALAGWLLVRGVNVSE